MNDSLTAEDRQRIAARVGALGEWYHHLELMPGFFTPSNMLHCSYQWENNRKVRSALDYNGKSVLDLGTMDGMWSFEAEQLNAALVVGADIWQNNPTGEQRFDLAREVLNSRVEKLAGADVHHLAKIVADRYPPFDIVQNLGLLYHVQNPMLALHQVRRCVRDNGFMLLETALWMDDDSFPLARFNSDLLIYADATTYWAMNYPCLIAMLKMTGWEPDEASSSIVGDSNVCRICIICRASKCLEGVDNFGAGLITTIPPS